MARCRRCRRCRREVVWARHATSGSWIPLDYRETQDGDAFVIVAGDVAVCVPEVGRFEARQDGRRLYSPHRRWCRQEAS
jgi:hypothetical protein